MFHHRFFGVKMDFPKSKDDLKQDTEKYLRGILEVGTIDYELKNCILMKKRIIKIQFILLGDVWKKYRLS